MSRQNMTMTRHTVLTKQTSMNRRERKKKIVLTRKTYKRGMPESILLSQDPVTNAKDST